MEDWETDIANRLAVLVCSDAPGIYEPERGAHVVHRFGASVGVRDPIELGTTHPNPGEPKPTPQKTGGENPPVKGPIPPIPRPKR